MTGAGIDTGAVPGAPASPEMAAVPGAAAAPGAVAVPDAAASRARRGRRRGGGAAREDRSTRIAVIVVVLALLASVASVLAQGRFREAPYEPSSPLPAGSKALVSVLEERGAEVGTVRRTDEAAQDLRGGMVAAVGRGEPGHAPAVAVDLGEFGEGFDLLAHRLVQGDGFAGDDAEQTAHGNDQLSYGECGDGDGRGDPAGAPERRPTGGRIRLSCWRRGPSCVHRGPAPPG